jgi:hypothetical protein
MTQRFAQSRQTVTSEARSCQALPHSPTRTRNSRFSRWTRRRCIAVFNDEPGGTTGVEDFRPGDEVEWNFFHDEVQYILKGKAEITYSLPPIHRKWYKTSAEEGSVYLIPRGARVKFKVIGNDPYRHLFVVMPGGFYPADKFDR